MTLTNSPYEDPENLLKQYEGLIQKLAYNLWRKLPETIRVKFGVDDLCQMGRIRFLYLARNDVNFDPSAPYYRRAIYLGMRNGVNRSIKKIDFLTFGVIDEIETNTGRDFFDVYGHEISAGGEQLDPEDEAVNADLHGRLHQVIEGLTERDQRILNLFLDGMSMRNIAQKEKLSVEWISRIIEKVQKKAAKVCEIVLQKEGEESGRKILQSHITSLVFRIYQESAGEAIDYKARVKEKLVDDGYSSDDKEFKKVDSLVEKAIISLRQKGYNIQAIDVQ
ncbi:sigma-70 family RNA polymerase sigma factor [Candidatus Peregrinibacteria bacterium]|nr:sigma-70 family RNA polymerase sigma factor [Candidatus Peregrinibacteria bacterium]